MSVESDLKRFGARRYFETEDTISKVRVRDIGVDILIAVGTRESNLMNVLNPAGTDRGVWQITDIYHSEWLASYPGCVAGTFGDVTSWTTMWIPVEGKTAVDAGYVPTVKGGAYMAYSLLSEALFEARRNKVKQPVKFALAAYNAGIGGALKGLAEGDVDKYTTGGDYSKDVLDVRYPQVKEVAARFGWF